MLPILMLAAQLVAKQQQEAEARRREVAHLAEERASRLGGNTMGVEAANFNRELADKSYASPAELMQLYGAIGGDGKVTEGKTSTTPGSDGLLNPWGPGNGGSRTDIIDPWSQDDPYGSKRRI